MAVHAQFLPNAFSPDVCLNQLISSSGGGRAQRKPTMDEFQMIPQQQILNNATVVFSDPQSELTCIASAASRKRTREESVALFPGQSCLTARSASNMIPGLPPSCRQRESAATSTSGRLASPLLYHDLVSLLAQQNMEIDALIRLQTDRLRSGLEEARKRHCRALLSTWEQQAAKRLMEKEAELETARRRNADLEEKLRQASAENQLWVDVAKSNEALVCSLRASLEQALLQSAAGGGAEGFGDSEGDEAQSCCFEADCAAPPAAPVGQRARACRACGKRQVCVLLLPCKHLCLCKECEPEAGACPVCGEAKNACLHVLLC